MLNLIISAKSLLPCKVTHLQIHGIRMQTSLGSRCSPYHMHHTVLTLPPGCSSSIPVMLLPQLLWVFVQMLPIQQGLLWPLYLKFYLHNTLNPQFPVFSPCSIYHLLTYCKIKHTYITFIFYLSPVHLIKTSLFYSLLYLWCLEQCLVPASCWINIYWVNDWIHD